MIGDGSHALRPVHTDVGIGTHQHSEVTLECLDMPNGFFGHHQPVGRRQLFVAFIHHLHNWTGQEIHQMLKHADRARSGASTPMRRGEGLMQVVMQHVEAQVAWPHHSQQRVHVRSVAVYQPATTMHHLDHRLDLLFEQAEGIGIGEHEAGDGIVALGAQRLDIDVAAGIGGDLHDPQAAHRCGGRVRSVGRVGDQNLVPLGIAAVGVIGTDDENPGQFPMCTRSRL